MAGWLGEHGSTRTRKKQTSTTCHLLSLGISFTSLSPLCLCKIPSLHPITLTTTTTPRPIDPDPVSQLHHKYNITDWRTKTIGDEAQVKSKLDLQFTRSTDLQPWRDMNRMHLRHNQSMQHNHKSAERATEMQCRELT